MVPLENYAAKHDIQWKFKKIIVELHQINNKNEGIFTSLGEEHWKVFHGCAHFLNKKTTTSIL